MGDPLSASASVLAIIIAAIQSTNTLCATVQRYKDRDKTLSRLHGELEDLVKVLSSLEQAVGSEASVWTLLKGPVSRCCQTCREFEGAMEKFGGKSTTGLRDWAKMEFMRDDINGFIDALAGYKSTIAVGLGVITMRHSKLSHSVLESYDEMIKDTAYNLEMRLQRIDEKLARITPDETLGVKTSVDLQNERDVTRQCLRICEDARSYLVSLQDRQPVLLKGATSGTANFARDRFDAEIITRQTLDQNRDTILATIHRLQKLLSSTILSEGPERDQQRLRLQEDINAAKQCLEVCKEASNQVSNQKIHIIREVVADDNTDQVVVTTLADLFDVGKVLAKSGSAQLVGSMTDDTLQKLSADRYSSRFGTVSNNPGRAQVRSTALPSHCTSQEGSKPNSYPLKKDKQASDADSKFTRSSPHEANEVRKRVAEGGGVHNV